MDASIDVLEGRINGRKFEALKKMGRKLLYRPIGKPYLVLEVEIPMESICLDGHGEVKITAVLCGWDPKKEFEIGKTVLVNFDDLDISPE